MVSTKNDHGKKIKNVFIYITIHPKLKKLTEYTIFKTLTSCKSKTVQAFVDSMNIL